MENVHTHILQDFYYGKEKFNKKSDRFEAYLSSSCCHNAGCQGIIISMVRRTQNAEPRDENIQNEASNHDHIQVVWIDGKRESYLSKIREIFENRNYNVTEILSNQQDVHTEFEKSGCTISYYTVFENELIVPQCREILRVSNAVEFKKKLHVFVDGSNVGQYKINEEENVKKGINFDNIRKSIVYLEDVKNEIKSTIKVHVKIRVILPKQLKMTESEEKIVNNLGNYIHKVDIIRPGSSEDDRYILQMAVLRNALIVSNDCFRNLSDEKQFEWKPIIDNRVMKFRFNELENNETTFELIEAAKNIYKYYLTGRFQWKSHHKYFYASGFGSDVEMSDIQTYLNIRGVAASFIDIRHILRPSLQVTVYLGVVEDDSRLLLSNGFWPNGVVCRPAITHNRRYASTTNTNRRVDMKDH